MNRKTDAKIWELDPWLEPFRQKLIRRNERIMIERDEMAGFGGKLSSAVNNHLYFGLHRGDGIWTLREWAPNATRVFVKGDFNGWKTEQRYALQPIGGGIWEISIPEEEISHCDLYKLYVEWPGGAAERIPAYATRCVQDPQTKVFCAQVWDPEKPYRWKRKFAPKVSSPLIYEAHIGMGCEDLRVGTFEEFRTKVLPYVASLGYNTLQIMALQEHPYYGSFGYQVANFFALSSRFGTPEEFKRLVDDAHGYGIAVIMDIVHSHSVDNEAEGLSLFDGREDLYFHSGQRGRHPAWKSRCFNYGRSEVVHFLLSNIKFWCEEYHIDGFRFDGVTSMIYLDHGLEKDFRGYESYFDGNQDEDAITYLGLANILVHELNPKGFTIAEDVSGMPGLAAPLSRGGIGFDYRMSMGVADHWIKWIKELSDWDWNMGEIFYELTNKRADEKTISYAECHDQAMVGDKTIIFRLMDKEMYYCMNLGSQNPIIDRGIALHKLIRLVTLVTAGNGYLTFMGNEFGHPEWIDFPREGNGWSYQYARRQWSLVENRDLRYRPLMLFDKAMIHLVKDNGLLESRPSCIRCDQEKKILIIERGALIFAFNFNPSESFSNYMFDADPGCWETVLDSDSAEFNGFGRNDDSARHFTLHSDAPGRDLLSLYLPSRTVSVLRKVD